MAVARVESAAAPAAQPGFRLSDAERLLVTAMEQASNDTPTASQVKATMLALDPSFDEANYGCRGFRDLRARLDHRVRTAGRSGADITLALVVQPVQQTTQP